MLFSSEINQEQRHKSVKTAIEWLAKQGKRGSLSDAAVANVTGFIEASQALGMRPTGLACILEMAITGKPVLLHSFELEKKEGGDALDEAADLNRRFKTSKTVEVINMLMAHFVADERRAVERQDE